MDETADFQNNLKDFNLEICFKYLDEFTTAISEEEEKTAITPGSKKSQKLSALYNNRGMVQYMLVNFEDAVADYTKAIEYHANMSQAYYNRGTICYRMGDFHKAIEDFEACLAIDPSFDEAITALSNTKTVLRYLSVQLYSYHI